MAARTRFRVRELAEQRGWSLRQLALRSGARYATVWEIANEQGNPTVTTLEQIADALDVNVRDLFDEDPVPA